MANIFVVSRMKNVAERKAAIDVIHSLGHEPGFIESQQMRTGPDATQLMDLMADRAEYMVIIVDDDHDLGRVDRNLGNRTPMVYEITKFLEKEANQNWKEDSRILVFGRQSHDGWSHAVKDVARILDCRTEFVLPFSYYDDLAISAYDRIKELWGYAQDDEASPLHLHIHWAGRDRPGRLGALAGFLFTKFGLNVTHLSGIGVESRGSIILTGTTARKPMPAAEEIEEAIQRELKLEVQVDEIDAGGFPSDLYFEVRVLDVPGVLNALCKVVGEEISIDDIRQRPTSSGDERQAEIMMWLSLPKTGSALDVEREYLRLEARLRNLVGVRALSSRRLTRVG